MSHGENLKYTILNLQESLRVNGTPVVTDGKGTIEKLFESFALSYNEPIDLDDIQKHMKDYYDEKGLDIKELQELEKSEYQKIYDEIMIKAEQFDDDIHSRRVLWTDDCCISMLHYLVRNNQLQCYLHLRSSDVVYKLFSDLNLIHIITKRLQDKLGLYNTIILVTANSFHEVVIKDMNKVK